MVQHYINTICEGCISGLMALKKPFKYTVSCVLMQNNGAGVYSAASCYWNTVSDGFSAVKWPPEKNKGDKKPMYCIVTGNSTHTTM